MGEVSVDQWDVKGLSSNIYQAVSEVGKPVGINQEKISDMRFDTSTYSETFDDNIFDLPTKDELNGGLCDAKCPALSICTFV